MNQEQITAKLSQINSKGLEATFSLSEAALENAQKLAELNYAASKDALVTAQDGIQQVLNAKDPKQVTEIISADALQSAGTQAVAYQRKVTKVLRDSNKELANVIEANIDQLQNGFQEWVTPFLLMHLQVPMHSCQHSRLYTVVHYKVLSSSALQAKRLLQLQKKLLSKLLRLFKVRSLK